LVRLADASTAVQLWNQEFRPAAIPELRDLVAVHIASSLGLQLIRAEEQRAERVVSPKAMELVGRARAVLRWTGKGVARMAQARGLLEEAVRYDQDLPEAWVMLAFTYLNDVRFSTSRELELRRAEQAVQRAVALAPDRDGVHYVTGWLYYEQGRMPQALAAFERATELNPSNVAALGFRGAALVMLGRPNEALAPIEQAMRLSPRDRLLLVWQMFAGVAHLHLAQATR
jgi:tetratricopeptide (TPR) repeat protein